MASVAAPAALALLSILAFAPFASSAAAGPCSHDVLTIEGSPLGLELCAQAAPRRGDGRAAAVTLSETLSFKGKPPFTRLLPLDVVGSAEASRTIDDVPLATFGVAKSLHLTIAYKPGSVRLEHALLVPGAITLK